MHPAIRESNRDLRGYHQEAEGRIRIEWRASLCFWDLGKRRNCSSKNCNSLVCLCSVRTERMAFVLLGLRTPAKLIRWGLWLVLIIVGFWVRHWWSEFNPLELSPDRVQPNWAFSRSMVAYSLLALLPNSIVSSMPWTNFLKNLEVPPVTRPGSFSESASKTVPWRVPWISSWAITDPVITTN